jgi:cytochrome c biogenesis protein
MASADSLYRSLVAVWRTLRSMRTALILLLVVGAASVFGSLVPQAPISPAAVADLFVEHPTLARVYQALGLFDVYGSWWFTLTYVLLLISLVSCLVPRTRLLVRGLRQHPQPVRELQGLRHFAEGVVPGAPATALARSRRVLRRRRFRVAATEPGLAAEKGGAREWGSLVFHWSLFVLLIGIVVGKGFGFTGQATVVEGDSWTEAHAAYDFPPTEGRFFTEGMHRGFGIEVLDFDAAYRSTGLPRDFVSRVRVTSSDGRPAGVHEIRVNDPLSVEGVKLYQQGYGWAPVIEVRQDGRLLVSEPVVFVTDSPGDQRSPWRGVIKLPSLRPQIGLELRLFPDPVAGLAGEPMLEARNPFLAFTAWRGDLRLEAAQSVFRLDTSDLEAFADGGLGRGQSTDLSDGVELTFRELREYTQLLVKRDPGTGIMLLGAALIVGGLLPALYSSRRRVWIRAVPADGEGTLLQVGGFALQRKSAFEEEFAEISGELGTVRPSWTPTR